jgi:hypothetical protein
MALSLKQFKLKQEKISNIRLLKEEYPNDLKIVAEGDSWFDYGGKKDIIDYLRKMGYGIKKIAKGGDTLENMIYGSKYKIKRNRVYNYGSKSLDETLDSIAKLNSNFLLFSGGGNDIVGGEIVGYLNHKGSNSGSLFNTTIFSEKLQKMKSSLQVLIDKVFDLNNECKIIMHGYDYPMVNGKGYKFLFFNLVGPWILPAMGIKGITLKEDQKEIVKYFIDEFNKMLSILDSENLNFNYLNLRGKFPNENQWDNEIHLKNLGFKTVANAYHSKIEELLNYNPLEKYKSNLIL